MPVHTWPGCAPALPPWEMFDSGTHRRTEAAAVSAWQIEARRRAGQGRTSTCTCDHRGGLDLEEQLERRLVAAGMPTRALCKVEAEFILRPCFASISIASQGSRGSGVRDGDRPVAEKAFLWLRRKHTHARAGG